MRLSCGGDVRVYAEDDAINAASSASSSVADDPGAAFQTGMAEGGVGMGDENCVIEVSDGYYVLRSNGDTLDSNGSVSVTGGVLLAQGRANTDNYVLDYDIQATVDGGTVIVLGGAEMTQNFTGGSQAFSMVEATGQEGQSVVLADASGTVLASFTAWADFRTAIVSADGMLDGETYALVVGDSIVEANEDGFAESGTVDTGDAIEVNVSTTAQSGFGGLGPNGEGMQPGEPGTPMEQGAPQQGQNSPGR